MDTSSDKSNKLKREYDENFVVTPEYRKSLPDIQNSGSEGMEGAHEHDRHVEAHSIEPFVASAPAPAAEAMASVTAAWEPSAELAPTSVDGNGYEWYSTEQGHWFRSEGSQAQWTKYEG